MVKITKAKIFSDACMREIFTSSASDNDGWPISSVLLTVSEFGILNENKVTSKCLKVVGRINRIIVTRICRLRHREVKKKEKKKGFWANGKRARS